MERKRTRKYQVGLTDGQVAEINRDLIDGKKPNTILTRGRLLLLLDGNHGNRYSHEQISDITGVCLATIANVSKLYAEEGFDVVMCYRRNGNSDNARRKLDGRGEARIIKMACGPVPEGHSRWTLRLLEDKARVELEVPVSKNTIARALKKTGFDLTTTRTGASRRKGMRTS